MLLVSWVSVWVSAAQALWLSAEGNTILPPFVDGHTLIH